MSPNISKRPKSINALLDIFITSGIAPKFDIDPTSPNPGPTLPMQVVAAVSDVMKSTPHAVLMSVPNIIKSMYITMKSMAKFTVASSCATPFSRMRSTALGCLCLRILLLVILNDKSTRSLLIPPAVDPAHAPCRVHKKSTTMANGGHIVVSAVAKPVVVMIVTAWNVP